MLVSTGQDRCEAPASVRPSPKGPGQPWAWRGDRKHQTTGRRPLQSDPEGQPGPCPREPSRWVLLLRTVRSTIRAPEGATWDDPASVLKFLDRDEGKKAKGEPGEPCLPPGVRLGGPFPCPRFTRAPEIQGNASAHAPFSQTAGELCACVSGDHPLCQVEKEVVPERGCAQAGRP